MGSLSAINPIRYRGYYFDAETGLYYLKSRYYDPQVGRFINADVFVDTGSGSIGLNPFAYCLNDPTNSIDKNGYFAETPFDLVTLAQSLIEAGTDPTDLWNWAIVVGDIVDVAVPFLSGFGESLRITKQVLTQLKNTSKGGFRKALQTFTGFEGEGMEAHHVFPQKYKSYFTKVGIPIDQPQFGAWVDAEAHRRFSYEYNQYWDNFLNRLGPNPTKEECMNYGRELSRRYGYKIYF